MPSSAPFQWIPQKCQQWQGGGGKASVPKPTATQKKTEAAQLSLLQQQLKDSKKPVEYPPIVTPAPAAPLPPPPAATSSDGISAAQEASRQALKRKGIGSTLLAGDTGGYQPGALGGGKTLLG